VKASTSQAALLSAHMGRWIVRLTRLLCTVEHDPDRSPRPNGLIRHELCCCDHNRRTSRVIDRTRAQIPTIQVCREQHELTGLVTPADVGDDIL
jgi:hypothetical protein